MTRAQLWRCTWSLDRFVDQADVEGPQKELVEGLAQEVAQPHPAHQVYRRLNTRGIHSFSINPLEPESP